jgi:NAD(P)H-hydrate epimerase
MSTQEIRLLDQVTETEFGIPSRLLMENAGRAVAVETRRMMRQGHKAVVVCGPGNNGGDGLVAARHLANAGIPVEVLLLTENLKGDAALNLEAFRKLGGAIRPFMPGKPIAAGRGDVMVDAVLGVGLTRPPEGLPLAAIEHIRVARELGAGVLSVDLPSGLDADSGRPPGACVTADRTVTFAYVKRGLALEPGASLAGKLILADISIPRLAESRLKGPALFLLREDGIRSILPQREADAHKGNFGHVLVIAGSPGKSGAAAMTCAGALRGGAGLVTLAARAAEVAAAQAYMPEIMAHVLPGEGPLSMADLGPLLEAAREKSVIAAGPGLFRGQETCALLGRLLAEAKLPSVLDADALNALAESPQSLKSASGPVVITPHPGEMARLAGTSAAQVQHDRIGVSRRFADAHRVTVVLKGARTVIADVTGGTAINPTGNPGMATGGSGDVLTGLCASLIAQRITPGSAACAAVFVHGLAGDLMNYRCGRMGLVATDLLEGISRVWAKWGV